jgi:tetratricopeptide (TPR) repeat protein
VWFAAAAGVVLLLASLALAAFLLTRKPAPPVYVAVLPPEVTGALSPEDQARVGANLQASLLRTVAALEGLAALGPAQVNRVKGSPAAIARAVAAGEVIASRADCAGELCQVTLQRLAGGDGRVLGSEALTLPSSQPKLFADSAAAALRHVYADRRLRVARLGLAIDEADYRAFFDLRQRIAKGEVDEAILTRLDELRGRAPDFLEAYTLEARVARRLHHDTGERRYLDRGLAVAREALPRAEAAGDPAPFQALIDLDRDAGRLDDAEAVLARLYEIDPAGSLLQRGQLAKQRGHPEEALELLHAAVRLQPSRATLITVANVEYELSRFDDARRHAGEALARSPGDAASLNLLAQIELLRNPDQAVALLRAAVKSDPGSLSLNNLGASLLFLRRYGEAEAILRKALALQPEALDPALNLADCLTLLGRTAEARTLYARLAELGRPGGPGAGARPPGEDGSGPRRPPAGAAPEPRERPARFRGRGGLRGDRRPPLGALLRRQGRRAAGRPQLVRPPLLRPAARRPRLPPAVPPRLPARLADDRVLDHGDARVEDDVGTREKIVEGIGDLEIEVVADDVHVRDVVDEDQAVFGIRHPVRGHVVHPCRQRTVLRPEQEPWVPELRRQVLARRENPGHGELRAGRSRHADGVHVMVVASRAIG